MRISLQSLGSLGDVVPFIALGRALVTRGHEVSLLAPDDYEALIKEHGLVAARPPGFSVVDWLQTAAQRGTLNGPIKFFRDWPRMITPRIDQVMAASLEAAKGADLVVANLICVPARIAAEACGAPFVLTAFQPALTPTREAPCVMVAKRDWGVFNKASYGMVTASLKLIARDLQRHRRALGLPARPSISDLKTHLGRPLPHITSMPSQILNVRPADWNDASHLVDYWPLSGPTFKGSEWELKWDLDRDLEHYLEAGDAPIYIGLGSMELKDPARFVRALLAGLKQTGRRAIFAQKLVEAAGVDISGHFALGHTPHAALLPHCAAIVHHGGAGTIDTALRAGCPQIVLPHNLDQFWQSKQLRAAGLCPSPVPAKQLKAQRFAEMIVESQSADMAQRVAAAQKTAAALDGIAATINILEAHVAQFNR